MAYGSELEGILTRVYQKLSANSIVSNFVGLHPEMNAKQIYEGLAPEGARLPYCIFSYMGGNFRTYNSGRKILNKAQIVIELVSSADSVKQCMPSLAAIQEMFQLDQDSGDIVIMGSKLINDFCQKEVSPDGGLTLNRTGVTVSIIARAQNPDQI